MRRKRNEARKICLKWASLSDFLARWDVFVAVSIKIFIDFLFELLYKPLLLYFKKW